MFRASCCKSTTEWHKHSDREQWLDTSDAQLVVVAPRDEHGEWRWCVEYFTARYEGTAGGQNVAKRRALNLLAALRTVDATVKAYDGRRVSP